MPLPAFSEDVDPIMDLELSTRAHEGRALLSVAGEVDLETASQLGDAAADALQSVSPHLLLDLSGVTFMDSTGLKVLLAVQRRADLAAGSLAVAGTTRPVSKILALTGLDPTVALYDSVEAVPALDPPVTDDGAPTT